MPQYVGILEGAGRVWSIRIPDVPGCHGGGKTADAALEDTVGALRLVAGMYADDGIALRQPRTMEAIRTDPEAEFNPKSESLVMIPLLLDKGRSVKANISLDAGLLEQIDVEAKRRGLTRSAFLVSAAVDKIRAGR